MPAQLRRNTTSCSVAALVGLVLAAAASLSACATSADVSAAVPGDAHTVPPEVDAGGGAHVDADADDAGDLDAKPRCRGLMPRNGPPTPADRTTFDFIDSSVVDPAWSDLEPSPGVFPSAAWQPIDDALAGGYNVRLRIRAGIDAPEWVRALVGPARPLVANATNPGVACDAGIGVYNSVASGSDGRGGCVPYFWTKEVGDAYEALIAEVARRYEANDRLSEVVASLCGMVFPEVFYREHCQPDTVANLHAAGFDVALDLACEQRVIDIHRRHLKRTRTSLSVNVWDQIDSAGTCTKSFGPTATFVTWASGQLGDQLVIQHNHLSQRDGCDDAGANEDSCFISQYAGPRGFQTQILSRIGTIADLADAYRNGLSLDANFIEMPSGWMAMDVPTMRSIDAALRATR